MVEIAYDVVYRSIRDKIVSGEYPEKSMLPSEPQLCQIYSVSRTTVRKAIEILTNQGYVSPRRGVGTMVLRAYALQDLNRLTSTTQTLREQGFQVSFKKFFIAVGRASERISKLLEIPEGGQVACIERVVCGSGKPIALIKDYVPYEKVRGIEKLQEKFTSFYQLLRDYYFLDIEIAKDKLSATNATKEEAELLEVPRGFALIKVERKCLAGGQVICYNVVKARSDRYLYETSLFNYR